MLGRYLETKLRLKPSFLILGAQRSGTTSLYQCLTQHPSIEAARRKELHFFDYYYESGIEWYNSNFPYKLFRKKSFITGEATPYYLFHPFVAERVKELYPDMKFIVLLRNPIHRAYSHYMYNVSRRIESLSFSDAVDLEQDRIMCDWSRVLAGERDLAYGHQNFSYLSRGKYMDQINRWLKLFPRQQFHFIRSEVFFSNPEKVCREVFDFLEIKHITIDCSEIHKDKRASQSLPDKKTIKDLSSYFQKSNRELEEFLNDGFNWPDDK